MLCGAPREMGLPSSLSWAGDPGCQCPNDHRFPGYRTAGIQTPQRAGLMPLALISRFEDGTDLSPHASSCQLVSLLPAGFTGPSLPPPILLPSRWEEVEVEGWLEKRLSACWRGGDKDPP